MNFSKVPVDRFKVPLFNSDGMDAPSPAACAIVRYEPNEKRTSQVEHSWQSEVSRFTAPDGSHPFTVQIYFCKNSVSYLTFQFCL